MFSEDFETGAIPPGWTVVDGGSDGKSWFADGPFDPSGCGNPDPNPSVGGGWAAVDSDCAGAVVMDSALERVDELLHIGSRLRRIALQTAVGGMAASVIGMLVAAAGFLPPTAGALVQEAIDVVAVVNALRMSWSGGPLSDIPGSQHL